MQESERPKKIFPPTAGQLTELGHLAESLSKWFLVFVGVCYAVGIVVVNSHLGQYGYYSLSLFRVGYILSGFWSIAAFLGVSIAWFAGCLLSRSFKPQLSAKRIGVAIIYAFACSLLVIPPAYILGIDFTWSLLVGWLILFAVGGIWSASYRASISAAMRRFLDRRTLGRITKFGVALLGWWYLFLFTIFAVTFSQTVFRHIPASIGGGQPTKVVVVTSASGAYGLQAAGFPVYPAKMSTVTDSTNEQRFLSIPLDMLLVDDDRYVFIRWDRKGRRAISIKKELVETMIHLEEYGMFRWLSKSDALEQARLDRRRLLDILDVMGVSAPRDSVEMLRHEWIDSLDLRIKELEGPTDTSTQQLSR